MNPLKPLTLLACLAALLFATSCTPAATIEATLPAATSTSRPNATPVGSQVRVGACEQVAVNPTPAPSEASLFAPVSNGDWVRGPQDAPVTLIMYCDFQESNCANLAMALKNLQTRQPNSVRVIFRHFPLVTVFDKTIQASLAAEAAGRQGKFWEMHDLLYENHAEWVDLPAEEFPTYLGSLAVLAGLDIAQLNVDAADPALSGFPLEAFESGKTIGLPGVPLLLINGQIYTGPRDEYSLEYITSLIALGERQYKTCPEVVIDPQKTYLARIKTDKGEVVLRLFAARAPNTVNNFVFLVQNGWYDNITFHRVVEGAVVQTGDPSGTGVGGPGYLIDDEISETIYFDRPGLVAMANSGPNTNGSQFFITLMPLPQLNGDYSIFGEVVSGMSILKQITPRSPTPGQVLPPGDTLLSITIEEE